VAGWGIELQPRYGTDPVITLVGPPGAILEPTLRQRRRLADTLTSFDEEQWRHPSRCAGWSCRDVVVHLDNTNSFWAFSIAQGLAGEPTRFLATFDPVTSPARLVADAGELSSSEVLERFIASTDAFAAQLASLDEPGWSTVAEAPPGHVSISAVAHHALWDSWVHERDLLLPLGFTPAEEADEIAASLSYVAALNPALALCRGLSARGVFAIDAHEPDVSIVVEIDDPVTVRPGPADADLRLTGGAVDLLEALSVRQPLAQPIPPESAWMLGGLAETFDAVEP